MPFADPIKRKAYEKKRYSSRLEYWRKYRQQHPAQRVHGFGQSIGYKAEMYSLNLLQGARRIYKPADLSWNGKLVDVKTGIKQLYKTGQKRPSKTCYWKFYLKQLRAVDYFLFVLQDSEKRVVKVFLIPDSVFKSKYLRLAESKLDLYAQYEITP